MRRMRLSGAAGLAMSLALLVTGCSLQTLGAVKGDVTLTARFDDVQSLVPGHSVQLSDVPVGSVTAVRLDGYRARVTMSLTADRLPVGTTATIAKTSLLGENYVRLELPPGRDLRTGPFLADGAMIEKTAVQPDLEQISEKVGPLLTALGGQDLATIVDTSATAVNGKGPRLRRMIKQAAEISDSYAAASSDLTRALDSLTEIGDALAERDDDLDRLPGNVLVATERLKADRARLKRGIRDLEKMARSFNGRVRGEHGQRLLAMLRRTDRLLAAAARGKDDLKLLAQTLVSFMRSPSASHEGQALLLVWLKGFLPPSGGTAAADDPAEQRAGQRAESGPGLDLPSLLGPRS